MTTQTMPGRQTAVAVLPYFESDLCVKCNICTAACPVANATPLFPGPKAVGPQAGRFWNPSGGTVDPATAWCSGCGVCSRVCPHGVPVAEMNITAKAELRPGWPRRLRDAAIARPPELARWMRPIRPIIKPVLRSPWMRGLADLLFGFARAAPLPIVSRLPLGRLRGDLRRGEPAPPSPAPQPRPRVAFFHGCSSQDYEPWLGETTIRVLEHLGVDVELPPQVCCGLPLQSNHAFAAARQRAHSNLDALRPWAERGIPIVGTSTSCTLALKHEYRSVLGLSGSALEVVSEATYDLFEYFEHILDRTFAEVQFQSVPMHVLYHAPCQLRSHRIGSPALRVLRRIPGLRVETSKTECCGVAGTYGLKSEYYEVASRIGRSLFDQARAEKVDRVVTDSETCRWWIEAHSHIPAVHPVELLAAALGLPDLRPPAGGRR
jgi:glycerol-3-phosphate dehydrogenase subunit C